MDPFTQLPAELIQQILIDTADFAGIESLISVSSRVNAVLKAQPSIIHDLILGNPITRFPEIHRLCYNVDLINTSHYTDIAQYQEAREDRPKLDYKASLEILHFAASVQRLACACLSFMQDTLASTLSGIPAGGIGGAERAEKALKTFSWIEEYRTYWSLFHLHHYSALCKAATGHWNWPVQSIPSLDAYNVWNDINKTKAEEIWTVAAVLSDLGLSPTYGHHPEQLNNPARSRQHPEGAEFSRAAWNFSQLTPIPFFDFFDLPPSSTPTPIWSPPPIPPETEATASTRWQLSPDFRLGYPMHVKYFQNTALLVSRQRNPSLGMVQFKPWRRLGLVIWDSWRMYTVGLCYFRPRRNGPSPPNPDGTIQDLEEEEPDLVSRWLALVGENVSDA